MSLLLSDLRFQAQSHSAGGHQVAGLPSALARGFHWELTQLSRGRRRGLLFVGDTVAQTEKKTFLGHTASQAGPQLEPCTFVP